MGGMHSITTIDPATRRVRLQAGAVSLVAGLLILCAKFIGWVITDSQVVFSDAMESIVNVTAAGAMLFAIVVGSRPADEDHPYGHGKIEFLSAGFEGGLLAFAAVAIVTEAIAALIDKAVPHELNVGMLIVGLAGVANLGLGIYLIRAGRRCGSHALVADGKHVMSDFWTSAGAVVGLLLVKLTGLAWLDPILAMLVALLLAKTAYGMVRSAARGLMDEVDPEALADVAEGLEEARAPGIIDIHDLRAIDLGSALHVDLHVVVPEFWTVEEAHEATDAYQVRLLRTRRRPAELAFHIDPCERAYCTACDVPDCAVREAVFERLLPFTAQKVVEGPHAGGHDVHSDPVGR